MEAKNIIAFEYIKEDRVYRLEMSHGAPLGEAYEAAAAFLEEMVRMINEHAKNSMPKEVKDDEPSWPKGVKDDEPSWPKEVDEEPSKKMRTIKQE